MFTPEIMAGIVAKHSDKIAQELAVAHRFAQEKAPVMKDILIVVRDQLDYIRQCVESIACNTTDYHIYLWDNGSDEPTRVYLENLGHLQWVTLVRSEENQGFIVPNNRLAELTSSPYIILLNSDTQVTPGWSEMLMGWIHYENVAQVGCQGYRLGEDFKGGKVAYGYTVDYASGWGQCIPRRVYKQFGLFDEGNLTFAYGEDADYSLRLQEAGEIVYGLHADPVIHYENKTVAAVSKEKDMRESFEANHAYLRERWAGFLKD